MRSIFLEKLVEDPAVLRGAGKGLRAIGASARAWGLRARRGGAAIPDIGSAARSGSQRRGGFEEGVAKKMVSRATS